MADRHAIAESFEAIRALAQAIVDTAEDPGADARHAKSRLRNGGPLEPRGDGEATEADIDYRCGQSPIVCLGYGRRGFVYANLRPRPFKHATTVEEAIEGALISVAHEEADLAERRRPGAERADAWLAKFGRVVGFGGGRG